LFRDEKFSTSNIGFSKSTIFDELGEAGEGGK
jgi:hypothetical protein